MRKTYNWGRAGCNWAHCAITFCAPREITHYLLIVFCRFRGPPRLTVDIKSWQRQLTVYSYWLHSRVPYAEAGGWREALFASVVGKRRWEFFEYRSLNNISLYQREGHGGGRFEVPFWLGLPRMTGSDAQARCCSAAFGAPGTYFVCIE